MRFKDTANILSRQLHELNGYNHRRNVSLPGNNGKLKSLDTAEMACMGNSILKPAGF